MNDFYVTIITVLLGGGLFKGIDALYKSIKESKEKKSLIATAEAKTPREIESVAVETMTKALTSASNRIATLEQERQKDQEYYQGVIADLRQQLTTVRATLADMERKITEATAATKEV